METIKGTGVALITPFKKDMSVDYQALGKLLKHVIEGGVDYLVVMGTTGEAATLSKEERDAVVSFVIEHAEGLPVVLGLGGNNTHDVIENIKDCQFMDQIVAILSVVPYYNKPSQEGVFQHYKAIAESTDKSIIMYNIPGRTGVNMSAATCLRCADAFDNIVAVKEASGDMIQATQIMSAKSKDFVVLSGEDGLNLPLIALGFEGIISVLANAYPKDCSDMVSLCRKGDFKKANEYNLRFTNIIDAMFAEGNPVGVKAFLKNMGVLDDFVRLPLVSVSDNHRKLIGMLSSTY